jgi:SAM-dependent methyltransferase
MTGMLIKFIKSCLTHPYVRGVDIDSSEAAVLRSGIIKEKVFLRRVYEEFYKMILQALPAGCTKLFLEIGSGGGFLKEYLTDLISSEILEIPSVDAVLDATLLPFKKNTLGGIIMVNVFHHIPNADSFFRQASYCISEGGLIVMVEPWITRWSEFIYKYLHHEPFDKNTEKWNLQEGGPLSHANSALPWIVFERDRAMFEEKFPDWKIRKIILHTPFCYLLSGGVSMRSLMPGFLFPIFREMDKITQKWIKSWAMFALIVIERKDGKNIRL